MPEVYLASPLGFTESTQLFMECLEDLIGQCGFKVLNPWKLSDPDMLIQANRLPDERERITRLHQINLKIGRTNEKAIQEADFMVAVLDGSDVDSGTASEVGFAAASGKRIYGYRGDTRRSGDNPACRVNLQIEYWIENSGGRIVTNLNDLKAVLKTYLASLQ
jgi:nucleoside 2-deoxyribosyltransferase